MAKALRILFITLIVLALLVAGAVVLLPRVLDAGFVAEQVVRRVEARTGRDIAIDGPVSLSLFPWVGVDIRDVRLANAPGFGDQPMAGADQVQVRVKLIPLLSKRVEADKARISGLRLNLARDAQGQTNWSDLLPAATTGDSAGDSPPPGDAGTAAAAGLGGLTVQGVELADAQINWRDAVSGRELTVSDLDVVLSEVKAGAPVAVDAGFALDSPGDGLALDVTLDGKVHWAGADTTVSGLVFTATPREGGRLPVGQTLTVTTDVAWSGGPRHLRIAPLAIIAGPLKLEGELSLDAAQRPLAYQGQLRLQPFHVRPVAAALGFDLPAMQADDALNRLAMEASVAGQGARLRLEPLAITVDEAVIRGFAAWNAPGLAFDLQTDALDIDRYRPPGDRAAATPGAAATAGARGGLPRFPIDGELRIGRLTASGLTVSDLKVPVTARDGRLSLTPTATLYNGRYQGDIRMEARGGPTMVSLNEHLNGVAIGALLDDLQEGQGRLEGTADVGVRLSLTAADTETLLRSLNGVVDLRVADGALRGINLGRLVRQARAALRGESLPEDGEPPVTDFTELTASVNLAEGIARNNDLIAKSPLLRVNGEGQADLIARRVDYGLTLHVVATAQGQGGQDLDALRGVPIPVRITGPFEAPEYRLDLEAVLREAAESKLRDTVEERVEEKLQDELEGRLGEEGKGLLERLIKGQ